jgi:D-hydroxyproline dehydrogenase subunit gamma
MEGRLEVGAGVERGPAVTIHLDGQPLSAYEGESVAAAMLANGIAATRRTQGGALRGTYCAMGVCFECLVVVDGVPNTRACMTWVHEGMDVRRQVGPGTSAPPSAWRRAQ